MCRKNQQTAPHIFDKRIYNCVTPVFTFTDTFDGRMNQQRSAGIDSAVFQIGD
jgi:hypothetical protein